VDPVLTLPTLIGALAVLVGSTALGPLLEGTSWVLPLIEVVGVIWLVGVGARLLAVPAWGATILQVAGLTIALSALFASNAIGGFLPGPGAFGDAGRLLHDAWTQILTSVPPAVSSTELSFLIALSVGAAALIVDVLIAAVRAPALVALPLLSLFSVPASIDNDLLPWYAFVLPALLYVLLLAVMGHAGWGADTRAWSALAISGTTIAVIAVVGSLLLADSVTAVGTDGRLPHGNHPGSQVGLNPFASLHGNLQNSTPSDALVVSGLDHPDYLRTVALEKWTPDQGFSVESLSADQQNVDGALDGAPPATGDSETITVTPKAVYRDTFLPIYQATQSVIGLTGGWKYDSGLQSLFRDNKVNPSQYTITASFPKPTAAELETENVTSGGVLTQTGTLPAEVIDLAQTIVAQADAESPFDQALALQRYFTDPANGFSYSLKVPTGNTGSALLDFLKNKQGYCEQYAATMAIMLRSLGIPSRVAIGFTQGERQADGSFVITSNDAHAWVEVRFDTSGWVRFDPTPTVGGQGGQQGFVPGGSGGDTAAGSGTATVGPTVTSTTTTTPSLSGARATEGQKIDGAQQTYSPGTGTGSSEVGRWIGLVALILGPLLLVALLVAAPSTIRAVRRRRRLRAAAAGGPDAATAAWSEIEDTMVDHGFALDPAESARATANRLARTAHLSNAGRDQLRSVVMTAERQWYGAGADQRPEEGQQGSGGHRRADGPQEAAGDRRPVDDLAPGVLAVADGLDRVAPRRLVDRLLPRSIRPGGSAR
jgi:transglutaminase-like putative cysteine protease